MDPAVALAHELLHVYLYANGYQWNARKVTHYFVAEDYVYSEEIDEMDAIILGLFMAKEGYVTEAQISRQLGLPQRFAYFSQDQLGGWRLECNVTGGGLLPC